MTKKLNKQHVKPNLLPWPVVASQSGNLSIVWRRFTKDEIADLHHRYLLSEFPPLRKLIDHLFDMLPDNDIPLIMGDYPAWVLNQIEYRLKNGRRMRGLP